MEGKTVVIHLKSYSEMLDKIERYEEALNHITTRKMSTYLTTSDMNQDFIKVAKEALEFKSK